MTLSHRFDPSVSFSCGSHYRENNTAGCFSAQRKWCHYACSHVLEDCGWIHDLTTSTGLTCSSLKLGKWYARDSAVVMRFYSLYHSSDFCKAANPLRGWLTFSSWQKPGRRGIHILIHTTLSPINYVYIELNCFPNYVVMKNVIAGCIMFIPFKMYLQLQICCTVYAKNFLGNIVSIWDLSFSTWW